MLKLLSLRTHISVFILRLQTLLPHSLLHLCSCFFYPLFAFFFFISNKYFQVSSIAMMLALDLQNFISGIPSQKCLDCTYWSCVPLSAPINEAPQLSQL